MANPHLFVFGALGFVAGAWWRDSLDDDEDDEDDDLRQILEDAAEVIVGLAMTDRFDREDELRDAVAEHLAESLVWTVEKEVTLNGVRVDIVVGTELALELKLRPNKTQVRDAIMQAVEYSEDWVAWLVLAETKPSLVRYAVKKLKKHGLDHVLVLALPLVEDLQDEFEDEDWGGPSAKHGGRSRPRR